MKKSKYAILKYGNIPEMVSGYTFEYEGIKFGVRNREGLWDLTELSTGTLVWYGIDRKKDVIPMLQSNPELIQTIKTCLKKEYAEEQIKIIGTFYKTNS